MNTVHLSTLICLVLTTGSPKPTLEELGDQAWSERANVAVAGDPVPDAEATRRAVVAYERAHEADPENLGLYFKLMEALYFEGYFVVTDPAAQRRIYEREVKLAGQAVDLVERRAGQGVDLGVLSREQKIDDLRQQPEAVDAHFWGAITWGLWGMSHSRLASGAQGVAQKIRDHAEMVVALDETYADAGGLRLLGRLHTATPKIPFFTGWIDRQAGLRHLRRALELSRRDPRNLLFLAEGILAFEKQNRGEALELLREASLHRPDPDYLVEQMETIELARQRLAELEEKP